MMTLTQAIQNLQSATQLFNFKTYKISSERDDMRGKYRVESRPKDIGGGIVQFIDGSILKFIRLYPGQYTLENLITRTHVEQVIRKINKENPRYEYTVSDIHLLHAGVTFELRRKPRATLHNRYEYPERIGMLY